MQSITRPLQNTLPINIVAEHYFAQLIAINAYLGNIFLVL